MKNANYILTLDAGFVREDELHHYGIKGMKWGIRRYQNPDGSFISDEALYHYGIKGMRWGIRRYQNPDGSLTPAGKKKYAKVDTLRSSKTGEKFYIAQKRNKYSTDRDRDFIITKDGKKIGNLFLEDHGSDLYINWVDIKKSERGKGYANQVMDYVVKYSMKNGYKTVSLEVPTSSPDARHIYEKHGFVEDHKISNENDIWEGLTSMKRQN